MYNLLDIYSDYLIAQNQHATAVGLSDLLEGRISHDKITRFLNGKELTSKELWEYVKPEVRKTEEDRGGGASLSMILLKRKPIQMKMRSFVGTIHIPKADV